MLNQGRDLAEVRPLFDAPHLGFVIDSMIAGHTPASLWVSSSGAVVFDGGHCLYLARSDRHSARIGPRSARYGPDIATVVADLARGRDGIVKVYGDIPPLPTRARSHFVAGDAPPVRLAPDRFQVASINDHLGELLPMRNFTAVLDEVTSMWGSLDAFCAAGFGYCAHDGSSIVSWCTAEYVSPAQCGIGIETIPSAQGQGLATAVGAAFLAACGQRSILAHWDAWTDNRPSIAVAENLGFRLSSSYHVGVTTFAALRGMAG